jgi:hypothetical protein
VRRSQRRTRRFLFLGQQDMNEPVLVLNHNFEPLNVCHTRRAVGLLMVGKAELVENGCARIVEQARDLPP